MSSLIIHLPLKLATMSVPTSFRWWILSLDLLTYLAIFTALLFAIIDTLNVWVSDWKALKKMCLNKKLITSILNFSRLFWRLQSDSWWITFSFSLMTFNCNGRYVKYEWMNIFKENFYWCVYEKQAFWTSSMWFLV